MIENKIKDKKEQKHKDKNFEYTITNIPSVRVGSCSSFANVSSPFVTFPNIAYWKRAYTNLSIENITKVKLHNYVSRL